jgi:hypothetical protein
VPLDQLIAFDALFAAALAAALIVHSHRVTRQAAEARRALLQRFGTGELDLNAYERAMAELSAGPLAQTDAPLLGRLMIGRPTGR